MHLEWNGSGVLITNLGATHGLVVDADGAVSRLPAASTGGVLTRGRAEVSGPAWGTSTFGLTVVVEAPSLPMPTFEGAVGATVTSEPLRLRTGTKEFVTALMLCRQRLLDPTDTAAPPPVPELTRHVLGATNSWHLLHELDTDDRARARLTGRVHEHLKALRVKIVRSGLAERGVRLTPVEMVDLLVAAGAVTRQHLALLDDPRGWRPRKPSGGAHERGRRGRDHRAGGSRRAPGTRAAAETAEGRRLTRPDWLVVGAVAAGWRSSSPWGLSSGCGSCGRDQYQHLTGRDRPSGSSASRDIAGRSNGGGEPCRQQHRVGARPGRPAFPPSRGPSPGPGSLPASCRRRTRPRPRPERPWAAQ